MDATAQLGKVFLSDFGSGFGVIGVCFLVSNATVPSPPTPNV